MVRIVLRKLRQRKARRRERETRIREEYKGTIDKAKRFPFGIGG